MLRRIMNRESFPQLTPFSWAIIIRQRFLFVGVQIIHDQMPRLSPRIGPRYPPHDLGECIRLSILRYPRQMTSSLRFHAAKNIAGPASNILTVLFACPPGSGRPGGPNVFKKLQALLIQTNHRFLRIPRFLIKTKNILHPIDIFRRQLRHAPHFFLARASVHDSLK